MNAVVHPVVYRDGVVRWLFRIGPAVSPSLSAGPFATREEALAFGRLWADEVKVELP